jgi:hypothetical protein
MSRTVISIFSAILTIAVCGCTVRQPFKFQNVAPAGAGTVKLPLSVAVFEDPSLTFDYPPISSFRSFVEVMNPGLSETVYNAFGPDFQRIKVVHDEKEAANFDVLATPNLEPSDPVKFTIRFVEPKSGRLVAELSSVRPYDAHARGMYSHLIADVFLFATAVVMPVTEPFMTHAIQRHSAQRFNAMFAPAVAQTVGDIAAHTTYDPGLLSLAHERKNGHAGTQS